MKSMSGTLPLMNRPVDQDAILLLAADLAPVHGVGKRQRHSESSVAGLGSADSSLGASFVSGAISPDSATINSASR